VAISDINDRNGALLMFLLQEKNLPEVRNVLVDGSYTGARFERLVGKILGAKVEASGASCTSLLSFPGGGLWSAPSHGLRNAGGSGRTASVNCTPANSSSCLHSLRCY